MPHSFYSTQVKESLGIDLGAPNSYGTGLIFLPPDEAAFETVRDAFELNAKRLGLEILGWRKIKTGGIQMTMKVMCGNSFFVVSGSYFILEMGLDYY